MKLQTVLLVTFVLACWPVTKAVTEFPKIDFDSDADAKTAHDKAARDAGGQALNNASFLISDHRPVRVQLKVW